MTVSRIFLLFLAMVLAACGGGGGSTGGGSGGAGGSGGGTGGGTGNTGGDSGSGATAAWSTGQILSNQSLTVSSKPSVAIAPDGSAILAWGGGQVAGSFTPLMVSHLSPTGTTWSTPEQIDNAVGNVLWVNAFSPNPDVAMDANGNAAVVWAQDDGTQVSAFASHYQQSSDSWSAPVPLEADDTGATSHISVAMDDAGNAIAVWIQQTLGQPAQLWASLYSATSNSWSNSVVVDPSVDAIRPVIRKDVNNDFRVFYVFQGTTDVQLHSRVFDMTLQNWQTAETVVSGESQIVTIEVTQDSAADWVALWTALDGSGYESLYSSRRDATLGTWSSRFSQEDLPYNVESMTLVATPNGKLTLAWSQPDRASVGLYLDLYVRSYTPSAGWSTTTRLDDLGGRIPLLLSSGDDEIHLFWSKLRQIHTRTASPSTGWSQESRLICVQTNPSYCSDDVTTHDAAINTSKRAVYAWTIDVNGKTVVAASVLE